MKGIVVNIRLLILLSVFVNVFIGNATERLRRPISPDQPAWIIHIDVWNYADPQKIIDMVPEDVRPFVIFNIATSSNDNLSPSGPSIYDSWMKICAQNRVWTMIQCASGAPNRMPDDGSTSAYEQYFKDYPNFLGFNFAEQFWGFGDEGRVDFPTRLQLFADLLPICHQYGGYLAVSFCDSYYNSSKMPMAYLKRNEQLRDFLEADPVHFLCFEKYTLKKNFLDIESNCLGQWIGGYAGQYGIRFDSCGWLSADDETDQTRGDSDFVRAAGAIPVAEHMMLTGETIMDGPELTWRECSEETSTTTADDYTRRNWGWFPQFENISLDIFRKILDGTIRIPSKEEVIARTKVCIVNDINENLDSETEHDSYITPETLFDGLYRSEEDRGGASNHWIANRWWMKSTGRYPTIPQTYTEVDGMKSFKKSDFDKDVFDGWMQNNFPLEYEGDIFAGRLENGLVTYNPYQYDESSEGGYRICNKSTKRAKGKIPFQYNTASSIEIDYAPYSLGIIKEYTDQVTIYLSNYEGGMDVIKVNGAISKPRFSKIDKGSNTSIVNESWEDGVYTLTVSHEGGAVELTINCNGNAKGRKTAFTKASIKTPVQPEIYRGVLQYEAETADYKNVNIYKTGYNQGRDGYAGQGFAEMTSIESGLRFSVAPSESSHYLLTVRYQSDSSGVLAIDGEPLQITPSKGWSEVQMLKYLVTGPGIIDLGNYGNERVFIDCITLDKINVETLKPDADGEFHVNLGNMISSGNINFDAETGVVTQSLESQNNTGDLRLYFDHADFSYVKSLKVDYEGDGEIFKYLTITDNQGNSVNPAGTQGAFWSSKFNLDYSSYQENEASKMVCKLEWKANPIGDADRTMTIKDIVITIESKDNAVARIEENSCRPVQFYNFQGVPIKEPDKGMYLVKLSDDSVIKKKF